MVQFSAMPARIAISTASRLSTGNAPGSPMHTGQTLVFGGAPKLVGQPQKILLAVASCTCTSRPITGSYLEITSGEGSSATGEDIGTIIEARKSADKIEKPPAHGARDCKAVGEKVISSCYASGRRS